MKTGKSSVITQTGENKITKDNQVYTATQNPAAETVILKKEASVGEEINSIYTVSSPSGDSSFSTSTGYTTPIGIPTSSSEIQSHWVTIVELIKKERKWVYSMIKDSSIEIDSNKVCSITIHENRYEFLSTYQDYLSAKISDYFGESLKLNLVKSQTPEHSEIPSPSRTKKDEIQTGDNFEKIRSILIKELDARDVTDEETA